MFGDLTGHGQSTIFLSTDISVLGSILMLLVLYSIKLTPVLINCETTSGVLLIKGWAKLYLTSCTLMFNYNNTSKHHLVVPLLQAVYNIISCC